MQPLSLAAGSARARRQRRARRLGILFRVSALAVVLGTAGGVYAVVSTGTSRHSALFSNYAASNSLVASVGRSGSSSRATGAVASAPGGAVAIGRREQRVAAATARSLAAVASPSATGASAHSQVTGASTTSATGAATTSAAGASTTSAAGTATTSAAGTATTAAAGAATTSATGTATTSAAGTVTTSAAGTVTTSAADGTVTGQATDSTVTTPSPTVTAVAASPATLKATNSLTTSQAALDAADGTLSFDPPAYLMPYYRSLSARYGIAWPVLAALSYVQSGGYGSVLQGASAAPVAAAVKAAGAGNTRAINVNVIAQAASAASQPRPALYTGARRLAASGAALTPGPAIESVTDDYPTTDAVLTIAQQIGELPAANTATPAQKISSMLTEANLLNGLPYVWGGGHESPAWLVQSGFDCSGFVSAVLHAAGYLDSPQTTQTLPDSAGILSGPGQYVTMYDRTVNTMKFGAPKKHKAATSSNGNISISQATTGVHLTQGKHSDSLEVTAAAQKAIEQAEIQKGNEADNTINDEHVIIDIDGQWWESGGDSGDGGGASVHRIADINQAYLKSFNLVLHPAGL